MRLGQLDTFMMKTFPDLEIGSHFHFRPGKHGAFIMAQNNDVDSLHLFLKLAREKMETDLNGQPSVICAMRSGGPREKRSYDDLKLSMEKNPTNTAVAKAVLIALGVAVIAPPLVLALLGGIGFTAGGVAAGSLAAAIQSAVYGGAVGAGSLFALCQSIAMGGTAVVTVGTAIGMVVTAAGSTALVKAIQSGAVQRAMERAIGPKAILTAYQNVAVGGRALLTGIDPTAMAATAGKLREKFGSRSAGGLTPS